MTVLAMSAALIVTAPVLAQDEHHPERAGQGAPTAMAQPAPISSTDAESRFEQARQQMKKMLAQMDKIHQTKDPKERQRLMTEHMQTMRDTMQAMHGMGGPMMMDMMGGKGMGDGKGPGAGGPGMSPDQRMNMMEDRMDMMQMMMEQMLKQHDQVMPER